jgi:hypothetical protein
VNPTLVLYAVHHQRLRQLPERSLPVFVYLRRHLIFLVGTTGDDLERVIR